MLENNEAEASRVSAELQEMRSFLEGEGEGESSLFLKVLQVLSSCFLIVTTQLNPIFLVVLLYKSFANTAQHVTYMGLTRRVM